MCDSNAQRCHHCAAACVASCGVQPWINILKTKQPPIKTAHMARKSGFVWHKSRSSCAIKVGSCIFSLKIPLFQGIFTPYDPSFYGIFWGIFFANMGGGCCQKYFQWGLFSSVNSHDTEVLSLNFWGGHSEDFLAHPDHHFPGLS